MTLDEYQRQAMTTCMKTSDNFAYMFFNLVGEVGEFASKIAKGIRKGNLIIRGNGIENPHSMGAEPIEFEEELRKEAGDILWQLSGLCTEMGWSLDDIAFENLMKLASRKKRNVIDGSGDDR